MKIGWYVDKKEGDNYLGIPAFSRAFLCVSGSIFDLLFFLVPPPELVEGALGAGAWYGTGLGRRGTGFDGLLVACLGNNGVGFGKAEVVAKSGVGPLGAAPVMPSTSCSNLTAQRKNHYHDVLA